MKRIVIIISIVFLAFNANSQCVTGNCYNGFGEFVVEGSYTYKGEFYKGLPDGNGTIKFSNGDVYKGLFEDGLMHGMGTYTWEDGSKYMGEMDKGKRHGAGELAYVDEEGETSIFTGVWESNKIMIESGDPGELEP